MIQQFPVLARQLGENFYNEKLNPISTAWLRDSIFTIREAAIENYKEISKIFGAQWASTCAVPRIVQLHTDSNYLHRLTTLFGIQALSQSCSVDTIRRQFIPVMLTLTQDRVANVRMNVAKAVKELYPVLMSQPQGHQDIIVSQTSSVCCATEISSALSVF